jgi:Holliday junction resolvase RusA-like endonuclease
MEAGIVTIQFTVGGEPVAQGRPRAGKTKSGDVVMYDPGKSKDYKNLVRMVAWEHRPHRLIESAVTMTVKVYRPIPDSWSKVKKAKAAAGELLPISKPDLSNYIKGIEDAIEGVILKNDSQIINYGDSGKWYSENPRIEVEIREVS